MKKNSKFQLIDGIFTANDAKKILNSMISNKIKYHDLEGFSNNIRFNLDSSHSKKRIEELHSLQSNINQILQNAELDGHAIELKCQFEIKITQNV